MLILWRLQLVWRQSGKKRQLSLSDYWLNRTGPSSAAPLSVQSSYRYENILRGLGYHIDAKISPKAALGKAQTTVSENRYTSPKIDVFQRAILALLMPTGNNAPVSFFVHQVPRTSAIVLWLRSFTSAFECPSITVVQWLLTYSTMNTFSNLCGHISSAFHIIMHTW